MGRSAAEIRRRLGVWLTGAAVKGVTTGRCSAALAPLVFVFTGQGAQWWAMGRQLLAREPVFRRALEAVDAAFQPLSGWSLLDVMRCPEAESPIEGTDVAQPAIFALQVALAELWQAWGIRPDKVIGHSVGEVAAACVAGIYSLADAAKILYHRGRLQHTTGGRGRMLAVGLSAGAAAC
jgi:acyl transferase domain-containing protein